MAIVYSVFWDFSATTNDALYFISQSLLGGSGDGSSWDVYNYYLDTLMVQSRLLQNLTTLFAQQFNIVPNDIFQD
jgi:hypothetical protein